MDVNVDGFPRLSAERIRDLPPEEAKAILIACAAIEAANKTSEDWRTELRFHAERTGSGWRVAVLRVYHRIGFAVLLPGIPLVEIDKDWNARVLPGA